MPVTHSKCEECFEPVCMGTKVASNVNQGSRFDLAFSGKLLYLLRSSDWQRGVSVYTTSTGALA